MPDRTEFPLMRIALPLSIGSHILAALIAVPFVIVHYMYRDTWMGEGAMFVPAIIAYLSARYVMARKEHPDVQPIVFADNAFYFPGNLFRNRTPLKMNLAEVDDITFKQMPGTQTWKRNRFELKITDRYKREAKVMWFATDLKKMEQFFKERNIAYNTRLDYKPTLIGFLILFVFVGLLILGKLYGLY